MFMRCFIAIEVPREETANLQKAQKMFTQFPSVRLLDEKLFHLTLNFLGDLEENEVLLVKKAMKLAVAGRTRFSCTWNDVCVFPSESFFRVICLKLEKNEALHNIQKDLSSKICLELGNENYHTERNFVPHITFARVRNIMKHRGLTGSASRSSTGNSAMKTELQRLQMQEKEKILTAISAANNEAQKTSFEVKEIVLMQSVLGPAGATYKTLEKITLDN